MFQLDSSPTAYDESRGGVVAGRDTVRLFPGAAAVLQRLLDDRRYASIQIAVASSTTEPSWANRCLDVCRIDPARGETIADVVSHRQALRSTVLAAPLSQSPRLLSSLSNRLSRSIRAPRAPSTSPSCGARRA